MRFSFFRDRLCIQLPVNLNWGSLVNFQYNPPTNPNSAAPNSTAVPSPEPKPSNPTPAKPSSEDTFDAQQLVNAGMSTAAANLLTNGGKDKLTEKQVFERLSKGDIYDFTGDKNSQLLRAVDGLNGVVNGSWKDAGATVLSSATNPPAKTTSNTVADTATAKATQTPPATDFVNSDDASLSQKIIDRDTATIKNALEKAGVNPNQTIKDIGSVFTGGDGSSDVRFYRIGEGENAKYVGITVDGQILSKEKLNAQFEGLNKTREAANQPKLNLGEIGASLESKYLDLNVSPEPTVPEKTEA